MPDPLAEVIPAEVRRPLWADGLCSRLMDTFTGGPFLAGLGLLVGASNFEIGLLAAMPFLAQAAQLPTLALLLRIQDRRATVLWAAGLARLLLAGIALTLWLSPQRLTATVLILVLAANMGLVVTATAAWNWWMRDTLPADRLGTFFGRRMRTTTVAALAAMLLAGILLDMAKSPDTATSRAGETLGYAALFAMGAGWGFAGLYALWRIPHAPPAAAVSEPGKRRQALRLLREAMRRIETRSALWALSLVSTASTFALPFVAVFLLRSLLPQLPWTYLAVTVLAVVSHVGYIGGLRGWGYLADRYGDRAVLVVTLGVLAAVQAGWAVTGWSVLSGPALGIEWAGWGILLWLAVLHFLAGYSLGGAELGGNNLMFRSAPAAGAQAHLAAIGLGRALLAGLGTVAAGLLWELVGTRDLLGHTAPLGWRLRGFQVLALVAVLLTLVAIVAALRIREPRQIPVLEVARTMRREVAQMSSIAGMRGLIHAVSYSVEFLAGPFAPKRRRGQGSHGPA
jgi:MFS family permease